MGKKRNRNKKKPVKVYIASRERKQGSEKEPVINSQHEGVVQHSIEILKLKIEQAMLRNLIAMMSRNRDNMLHFTQEYHRQLEWISNKVEEHVKACVIKMNLFLGESEKPFEVPNNFFMTSADLKSGFVVLENKDKESLSAIIMSDIDADFPNDKLNLGSIVPYNEEESIEVLKNIKSLFKSEDVLSVILSRKASLIENTHTEDLKLAKKWICVSATCMDRKQHIDLKDI